MDASWSMVGRVDSAGLMPWRLGPPLLEKLKNETDFITVFSYGQYGSKTNPILYSANRTASKQWNISKLPAPNRKVAYFDDFLNETIDLLNSLKSKDELVINIFTDGGGVLNPRVISKFIDAAKKYEKRSLCSVSIRCFVNPYYTDEGSGMQMSPIGHFIKFSETVQAKLIDLRTVNILQAATQKY